MKVRILFVPLNDHIGKEKLFLTLTPPNLASQKAVLK